MQTESFDDRAPLHRWRRIHLRKLCEQEGISIKGPETKDQLLPILEGAGIDKHNPPKLHMGPVVDDEPQPQVNLSALNFFELRKLCKDRNIPFARTDKRAELLAKLA